MNRHISTSLKMAALPRPFGIADTHNKRIAKRRGKEKSSLVLSNRRGCGDETITRELDSARLKDGTFQSHNSEASIPREAVTNGDVDGYASDYGGASGIIKARPALSSHLAMGGFQLIGVG
jgi:hypothetical protein